MLQTENLQGVYVIPSKESSLSKNNFCNPRLKFLFVLFISFIFVAWFGVIFVRSGLYEDGIFRFNVIFPENFPDCEHPVIY